MLQRCTAFLLALMSNSAAAEVQTRHSFTGRMCAASRLIESERPDSLFEDPLAEHLAGQRGLQQPMGEWILVPRTRFGDDFLVKHYNQGCRQLVLLGAGMDARAFRQFHDVDGSGQTVALPELAVFEVDQQTTFDVKEPLLEGAQLTVKSRTVVGTDFSTSSSNYSSWADSLVEAGFDRSVPTVWLLEGLVYYISDADVQLLMRTIGELSAAGSAAFHDSVTAHYATQGIAPGGAPFISGSDDYAKLWRQYAGFDKSFVRDFRSVRVDRVRRSLELRSGAGAAASPELCRGRDIVLFVETFKH